MEVCKRLKTEADYQQWHNLECQPARHDVLMPTDLSEAICLLLYRTDWDSDRLEMWALLRLMKNAGQFQSIGRSLPAS